LLYGALFTVLVPTLLMLWADSIERLVSLPVLKSVIWGAALTTAAAAIIFVGMATLWFRGGGLPMNAFPPPKFVSTGIYSLVPHPIYGGFVLMCAGLSLAVGSASGFWFVTPLVAIGCTSLVLGYEMPDLRKRFGASVCRSLWLPDSQQAPEPLERLRIYFIVLLPWLALYQSIGWLGPAPDALVTYGMMETRLPVWQWTEVIYGSVYPVVVFAPLLVRTRQQLRRFALLGLRAMALIFPLYLLLPFATPARPFVSSGMCGHLLLMERGFSKGAAAFPSFHVVWALIAASSLGGESRGRRLAWQVWAISVSLSCITTGMHSIADVVAVVAAYWLVVRLPDLWSALLRSSERIANSWKEWRFGSVRVINHGAYAAIAVFVGVSIMSAFLGNRAGWVLICVFVLGTVGAALWAQSVEGSPALLRPMGFYGGMLGCMAGALIATTQGISLWNALGALCMAAPWVQAIGRLRCLVQGCCHGREAYTVPGIQYSHPRSRVCRLTNFSEVAIHATPVYSILWNGVVAAALIRLTMLHAVAGTICAVYLILSGMGRFVEEAYRGEPQTKVIFGLRLYQWAAIGTVILGAAVMTYGGSTPLSPPAFTVAILPLAIGCGLVAWFVCGVDFPESSHRFARLT
jgi:prolipoprotein diacylglyceryltransferase/protein-S-isoprenylcysteine O-methyltransferase Ste14